MKKRFVCFLLTLVLLVSLVPATALTASAASYGISNSAITVLKKMVSYNRYCYRVADSSEFRVGYGTICTDQHKWVKVDIVKKSDSTSVKAEVPAVVDSKGNVKIIAVDKTFDGDSTVYKKVTTKDGTAYSTKNYEVRYDGEAVANSGFSYGHYMGESAADAALRNSLAEIDKQVDSFASSNSVTLNQSKHDALTVMTYLTGTAWMNGTNATKTAIINNAGAAELFGAIAKNYGTANADAEARAKVLTNMYVNGVYANIAPSNYTKVAYNPNGGTVAGSAGNYDYYFDANQEIGHPVVPTRQGYTFTGWYLENSGTYTFMPKLNGDCSGKILIAQWQMNDDSSAWGTVITSTQYETTSLYADPNTGAGTWTYPADITKLKISATYVDGTGKKWAKIADGQSVYSGSSEKWLDAGSYAKKWVELKASTGSLVSTLNTKWSVSQLQSKALYVDPNADAKHEQTLSGSVTSIQASKEYIDLKGARWVCINVAFEGSTDVTGNAAFEKDGKTKTTAAGKWVLLNTGANGGISIGAASGAVAKATITYNGYVNVRNAAGTNNNIVGSVRYNETVDVFEIVTCNGHKWGRINGGWICLTYANVIMLNGNSDVDISSEGALAYTFSGKAVQDISMSAVHVSPNANSNTIDKAVSLKYYDLKSGTDVTVTNMTLNGSELWVKILWTAKYKDALDREQSVSAQGWVKITSNATDKGYAPASLTSTATVTLGASSSPIQLWPVRYTVSASELTVRDKTRSDGNIVFKMNQGVQFDAWEIALVGEDVWGFCREITDVNDKYDPEAASATGTYECGWANLSSKYVSRTELPGVVTKPSTNQYAVIVNCSAAKVRIGAGLYNKQIGTLPAGTEANILEYDEENGWYNLDVDVDNNPETGSWVFEQYVDVREGTIGQSNGTTTGVTTTNPDGSSTTVTTVRKGIVANTYGGLNVRQGPGTGYGQAGKLIPGTSVDIYEIVKSGTADWGRIDQGWVCMNYITLLSTTTTTTTTNGGNGTGVKDFETLAKTSTTAVYTGFAAESPDQSEISASDDYKNKLHVWTTPKHNLTPEYAVCQLNPGDPVTIYELLAVTEVISNNNTGDDSQNAGEGHGSTQETTVISYWARTSDGYIFNPQKNLVLNPLDEVVHTLTGSDTLNVRDAANGNIVGELKKGDQVKVTELAVIQDKVWGKIEYDAAETGSDANGFSYGWVRLDYFSEGAYYIEKSETTTTTTGNTNTSSQGNTGNTYSGGYVPGANASGYRYTAKVNYEGLNVRNTPSTNAKSNAQLSKGQSIVIYETTISENMAWGRCDGGWVYLYYVDLTPVVNGAVDARVVYNDNTIIYSDSTGSSTVGTYARMSVIDIYEIVGKMARTDQGWVNTDNLLP